MAASGSKVWRVTSAFAAGAASASAKIVNTATNLGALEGAPLRKLSLVVGVANVAGAYLGAPMAVARGSAFVRVVSVVVGSLILRFGWDVFA